MVRSEEFQQTQQQEQLNELRHSVFHHHQHHHPQPQQTLEQQQSVDELSGANSRKSSCDDPDEAFTAQPSVNEQHSAHQMHRFRDQKLKLLMLHNGGNNINDSALSSASSGSTELLPGNSMLLSPSDNYSGVGSTTAAGSGSCGSLDDKRLRRQIANCNERRRMQSINAGFQALRLLLPCKEGEKMSKAAILQQTAEFIHTLQEEKDRLAEEMEIFAQAKRRRIDNNSSSANEEQQMDTSDERLATTFSERNGKFVAAQSVSETPPSLDTLECLKTIEELRQELIREQQLRKIFEKEVVEMKNKNSAAAAITASGTASFHNNGFSTTNEPSIEPYSQIILCSQPQSQKISPLSHSSAFTAISSLQDALNSPLLSTATSNTTVISAAQKLVAQTSAEAGGYAQQQPSQVIIQPANVVSATAAAVATNMAAEETLRGGLSTITLTLPSDVISQLGQQATGGCNGRQPSHIVFDVAAAAANSAHGQFVTLNQQQHQESALQARTFSSATASQPQQHNSAAILNNMGHSLPQQYSPYANGNLLIQVNQGNVGLPKNNNNGKSGTYSQHVSPPQLDSAKIFVTQGLHNIHTRAISLVANSPIAYSNTTAATAIVSPSSIEARFGGLTTTASLSTPVTATAAAAAAVTPAAASAAAAVAAATSAPLSQRNLQAIIDAICHIEGGPTASMGNGTATASQPSCTQASDVLVR